MASPSRFFVFETELYIAKFFQFQKLVDEITMDSFDNVWKVVCFFLIWHAARTYGRRRGNIIVSNFQMYSCIWRGPKFAQFLTLMGKGDWGNETQVWFIRTWLIVVNVIDVLISRSHNGRIWIWTKIISLYYIINSIYLYLKICFLFFSFWKEFFRRKNLRLFKKENTAQIISKYLIILEVQLYLNTLSAFFFLPSQH